MRICDLRQKEVINCCDGNRLGFVCDVIIDMCDFCISHIIIPGPAKVWGMLGREFEYVIPICCIKRIGKDVILVEVEEKKHIVKCEF